jgi:hypothetical protein
VVLVVAALAAVVDRPIIAMVSEAAITAATRRWGILIFFLFLEMNQDSC